VVIDVTPSLAALLVAVALDRLAGEPPLPAHPVVWMGTAADAVVTRAVGSGARRELAAGAVLAVALPAAFAVGSGMLLAALGGWSAIAFGVHVYLLKSTIAVRALGDAAHAVRDALAAGDVVAARAGLRSLCSRDPSNLDAAALTAASIESVAENASDSVVAPLVYYAVLGVPGAVLYKGINTLDSMIGYRGRYEHLGKAAARLDDAANFVPARLTAALLLAAGALTGRNVRDGVRIWRRDARRTRSPNAGHPMAMMAGLLDVELAKHGEYRLGDARAPLTAATIDHAWRIAMVAFGIGIALCAAAIAGRDGGT
jgi:adenosylcobinamide-phosphate synthase